MSLVKKIYNMVQSGRSKRSFSQNASVSENVKIGPNAACSNMTGCVQNISIGENCYLDCVLAVQGEGKISIGSNCWIGGGGSTAIGAIDSVSIGSHVIISNHVHIYDNNNHPTDPEQRMVMTSDGFFNENWNWTNADYSEVVIGDNVWIGEYSAILKGVTIGEGSIVASHSVVTKDVPSYTIVAGNPAKVVKELR